MEFKKRILTLDEYVEKLNTPVKASDHGFEEPLEKINRMFKSAIKKAPQHTDELKKEWIKMKEKQLGGEVSNLDYQIKEILSRYNVAYLSESEDDTRTIVGNTFNDKAKEIRKWLEKNADDYNIETEHDKFVAAALKHFKMEDKTNIEKDDFIQLVNINLE